MTNILNLERQSFLSRYWQKQPCVIKGGLSEFMDLVDEHQLAGLAMEEEIDSRIISRDGERWQVKHGPFEDFEQVCQNKWTLLVQSVDHYLPQVSELLEQFDFIPQWRLDDIMISFSVAGAGVGPHLDQYDVFIIQGKGRRHWQVADKGQHQEIIPCQDLKQIADFTAPIIDEVLEPGDIIYIPPGYPHNGVALEECLNYSVGFRAPDQATLLSSFSDYLLDHDLADDRYGDPDLTLPTSSLDVLPEQMSQLQTLMSDAIRDGQFENWLCRFLSQSTIDVAQFKPESEYSLEEVSNWHASGMEFARQGGVKVVSQPKQDPQGNRCFYINTQAFSAPENEWPMLEEFLKKQRWANNLSKSSNFSLFFLQTLTTLVNAGYWYPVECGEYGDDV